MIEEATAHLRWVRPVAGELLSAVLPILPAVATLGVTSAAVLLVGRVARLLRRDPNREPVRERARFSRPATSNP